MTTSQLPPVEQVAPGLWSLPVPIPIRALRYVLVYALETPDGIVLIDAGWDTPEAWSHLTGGLAELGASPADVDGLLITHIHPDHYGLAGRVRDASDAWIALHPADAALLEDDTLRVDSLLAETLAWARRTGAPTDELETISPEVLPLHPFSTVATPDVLLEDRARAPVAGWELRAVHTPGHSPGHLCFHDPTRQLLFSGDHVLPGITPNVSVHPLSGPDPLGHFLDSLAHVRQLPTRLALPAHQWRFDDLPGRVDELVAHHETRLEATRNALHAGAETTYEVAAAMPWARAWDTLPMMMRQIAIGEAQAHLVVLTTRGQAVWVPGEPDRWIGTTAA